MYETCGVLSKNDFVFFQLPSVGDVWSCYIDYDMKRMDAWERIVPQFKYNAELPFFEMIVPTMDTVR